MTKQSLMRLRYIYKILLSVSIIISGICLIAGCAYIFFSGDGYSREIVTKTFNKINIPIYFCLILIIADTVWEIISPSVNKNKSINKKVHTSQTTTPNKKIKIIRYAILAVALIIMIIGFFTGGYADVLTKAVNICTECIGLG